MRRIPIPATALAALLFVPSAAAFLFLPVVLGASDAPGSAPLGPRTPRKRSAPKAAPEEAPGEKEASPDPGSLLPKETAPDVDKSMIVNPQPDREIDPGIFAR